MPLNEASAAQCTSSRIIPISSSLSPESFKEFGEVIQNPETHGDHENVKVEKSSANQGTATKWIDISHLENWYTLAPSRKSARSVVNMFVCKPRQLEKQDGRSVFPVRVLERHAFTPQTFVPLGINPKDESTRYLVIVAPTLKPTVRENIDKRTKPYPAEKPKRSRSLKDMLLGTRPNPFTNDYVPSTTPPPSSLGSDRRPKGSGEPDLDNIGAFLARGDQAVTYGPGTWHAPMVVLGDKSIEFVVVQYANGVALEDCQEVDIPADRVFIDVGEEEHVRAGGPGIIRAKL